MEIEWTKQKLFQVNEKSNWIWQLHINFTQTFNFDMFICMYIYFDVVSIFFSLLLATQHQIFTRQISIDCAKKKLHPTYEFRQIFIVFPFIQCVYTKKIQQRFAGMTNIRTKKINILTLNQSLFNTYIFVRSVICFAYERPIESQSAVNSTLDLLLLKLFVVDLWFLFPCCFFWLKR